MSDKPAADGAPWAQEVESGTVSDLVRGCIERTLRDRCGCISTCTLGNGLALFVYCGSPQMVDAIARSLAAENDES